MEVNRIFRSEECRSDEIVEILYLLLSESQHSPLVSGEPASWPDTDLLSCADGVTNVLPMTKQQRNRRSTGLTRQRLQ
jgi:hypothetical protein